MSAADLIVICQRKEKQNRSNVKYSQPKAQILLLMIISTLRKLLWLFVKMSLAQVHKTSIVCNQVSSGSGFKHFFSEITQSWKRLSKELCYVSSEKLLWLNALRWKAGLKAFLWRSCNRLVSVFLKSPVSLLAGKARYHRLILFLRLFRTSRRLLKG